MKVVLHMQDRRPIWRMPERVAEEVRAELPPDGQLVVVDGPIDGSGDGSGGLSAEALAAVEGATVYLGFGIPAEILRAGRQLRWVHSGAAGVGSSLTPEMLASDVIFTNSAGIHAPPMAENVLGMILHFARGFDLAVAAQARREWGQEDFYGADVPVRELAEATVGILGFGGIGREVARVVGPLAARVVASRRRRPEEEGSRRHPEGTEVVYGREGLERLLAESDYLVLAAPDTPQTRRIIDEEALRRMKGGAVLLNVARGALVDEEALIEALRTGRLRGAGLDVFGTEPLPAGHPFWSLPNVLVTPHVSAVTRSFWGRQSELILGNLRAFLAGEPLRNVVDRAAGY